MSDKKLLNENTIRRFMTLAKVDRLTDNFINEKKRQEELEEASYMEEDEEFEEGMGYSMEEDEMLDEQEEEDVELDLGDDEGDEEAMDDMDAGMDASDDLDDAADDEMDAADAAGRDRMSPAGRDRYNRRDVYEGTKKGEDKKGSKDKAYVADKDQDEDEDGHRTGEKAFTTKKGMKKKTGPGKAYESLDLDVIDDEELTEAVLQRVVERLLKRQ